MTATDDRAALILRDSQDQPIPIPAYVLRTLADLEPNPQPEETPA